MKKAEPKNKLKNKLAVCAAVLTILSGCGNTSSAAAQTEPGTEVSETTAVTEPVNVYVPTDSDKTAARWFEKDIFDSDVFTDIDDYRYYARTLGQDKDFFLDPEKWEVFYNEQININRDIDEKEIYLIRLNPYKLLELYAENNNTTVDKICERLSLKKEQLYYNWGYDPASVDYMSNHKDNKVTYSKEEQEIFGSYNGEARGVVMRTHLLTVEKGSKYADYSSSVSEKLSIYRRDILSAFTEDGKLYSDFSEIEKQPAFKLNGIGIRSVVPLSVPNAYSKAQGTDDENISVMINVSPFAYGCTDSDRIDIAGILEVLNSDGGKEKK